MAVSEVARDEMERNKAIVRQGFEEIANAHDPGKLKKFIADDFIDHSIFGRSDTYDEKVRNENDLNTAFPDYRIEIIDIMAEGDKVVTRSIFTGTHTGDFAGVPGTGRKFSIVEIDIFRMEDGKAVEHWDAADTASLYRQLGIPLR
ncbi:MAG: ester cyclase [Methanomassiliicoccus sp.]|nr:ester cyclase [Methanomassiliicoccus sp.]